MPLGRTALPALWMDGPAAPQVLGWKACLKDFQASLPSTPIKPSNHTKQVFQASLSSKSSTQALAWKTCLEDLLGRHAWVTCWEELPGVLVRLAWDTCLEEFYKHILKDLLLALESNMMHTCFQASANSQDLPKSHAHSYIRQPGPLARSSAPAAGSIHVPDISRYSQSCIFW